MRGVLIRMGIDQSCGAWNGPFDPVSRHYVYVPIPETRACAVLESCVRRFDELQKPLSGFANSLGFDPIEGNVPAHLSGRLMHLDPDFDHLTYGDKGTKGACLAGLKPGDLVVFYAGMNDARFKGSLAYVLIGLLVVEEVLRAQDVPAERRHENAHTRRRFVGPDDVVVRGRAGVSGRLDRAIPIGEYRERAYRVLPGLLDAWGGLSVRNGYLQRSAQPPALRDPTRFQQWFGNQGVKLLANNYLQNEDI